MDKALLEKAAQCKSADEIKSLAAEAGMDISEEQAGKLLAGANGAVPLTDEELETVAGGCGSDDDIISCEQCGASIRRGDAFVKSGDKNEGPPTFNIISETFRFCCETCFETFKNSHREYTW